MVKKNFFEKLGMFGLLALMTGLGMVVSIELQSKIFAWALFAGGVLLFFVEPIITKLKHFVINYC